MRRRSSFRVAGAFALAASTLCAAAAAAGEATRPSRRLDGYTVRVFKWAYYLVAPGLSREQLLAEAGALRRAEPDTQLVLVDDESGVQEYIAYARAVSEGRTDVSMPKAWADAHVVANLQKLTGGRWMLYESYGYEEIGEVP